MRRVSRTRADTSQHLGLSSNHPRHFDMTMVTALGQVLSIFPDIPGYSII
jgi:hypothetical protein